MINICTVSDYKYLSQGLAMYESLIEHTDDFRLFYLCIDDKTFDVVHKHESKNLLAFHIDQMSPEVLNLRNGEYKYFCWSLASCFTNFLMNRGRYGDINYIDSDIFFYDDFNVILDAIGDKSVGLFRHRQFNMNFSQACGWFNVGVLHFKDDVDGRTTLAWWADAVLNKKYPELATCGDQKYLDAFLELGDKIFIDGDIGHGAPWQWQLYKFKEYEETGNIIWGAKTQKLIFSHFSQFAYDLKLNSYTASTMHHCYTPSFLYTEDGPLKNIYDRYFEKIKLIHKKYL